MIPYVIDGGFGWIRCGVQYTQQEIEEGWDNEMSRQVVDWTENGYPDFIDAINSRFRFYEHAGFPDAPIACVPKSEGWAGIDDYSDSGMSEKEVYFLKAHPFEKPYRWNEISASDAFKRIRIKT